MSPRTRTIRGSTRSSATPTTSSRAAEGHSDRFPPAQDPAGGPDPTTPAERPARAEPGADADAGHPGVGRGRDDDLLPAAVPVPRGGRGRVDDVPDRGG